MTEVTWLDAIDANGFDEWTRMTLIIEAQRTKFPGDLPAGFEFLGGGFVDLGFENLGLAAADLDAVRLAFVGVGVRVPGTSFRLRNVRPFRTLVEPADGGGAATLPGHWREGVLAFGRDGTHCWAGSLVPPDRLSATGPRESHGPGDGRVPEGGGFAPPRPPPRRSTCPRDRVGPTPGDESPAG